MPAIAPGSALNLTAATRTLDATKLLSLAWRRGNPAYTSGAKYPWGDPPLSALDVWTAGYQDTQASWVPGAPQMNYPAWAGLADEAGVFPNGDAIAALGANPFSVAGGHLVVQPRLLTPAEAATLAATPFLAGRTWLSGAAVTAPFSQAGGYFSFTAKLPKIGPGIWPAFWLLPVSGTWPPEIDILEAVEAGTGKLMTTSVHTSDAAWNAANATTYVVPSLFDPSAGFHEYGALVEADFITTFWDRVAVRSVPTPADLVGQPLYMLADYAIGGPGSWPGPLPAGTKTVPPLVISDVGAWTFRAVTPLQAKIAQAQALLSEVAKLAA